MDVLLSSCLTMDIDSDKESHFTDHGFQEWLMRLVSTGVSTFPYNRAATGLIGRVITWHLLWGLGVDTVQYCSQDRKHRPGWHYLRVLLWLGFCLLVRISLCCPAGFPPWPKGRGSAGAPAPGVASLQSESAGWCAAGRCGKSAWLMQPCGANKES